MQFAYFVKISAMIEKLQAQLAQQEEQLIEYQKRYRIRVSSEKETESSEKQSSGAGVLV